jgi:hypothetical protein
MDFLAHHQHCAVVVVETADRPDQGSTWCTWCLWLGTGSSPRSVEPADASPKLLAQCHFTLLLHVLDQIGHRRPELNILARFCLSG